MPALRDVRAQLVRLSDEAVGAAGEGQNAGDDVTMDAELTGDGAAAPLLHMIVAQDLGVQLGGYDHRRPQDGWDQTARRQRR